MYSPSSMAAHPSDSQPLMHKDGGAPSFPSGLRLLVVDDDPTCLMIVAGMLRKCNYEGTLRTPCLVIIRSCNIVHVQSGSEARPSLALFAHRHPLTCAPSITSLCCIGGRAVLHSAGAFAEARPAQVNSPRATLLTCCLCLPAVTTSVNGLNALALLRSQPNHFDLVLSDVVMPGKLRFVN